MENSFRNIKHLFIWCFFLFSLSPCIVKGAWLSSANVDYTKPLNKTKSLTQKTSCQYPSRDYLQFSVVKQKKIDQENKLEFFSKEQFFKDFSVKVRKNDFKTFSGNSPPKYILYKRLKLDIA